LNIKIPDVNSFERLTAGVAAEQHSLSLCQCEEYHPW